MFSLLAFRVHKLSIIIISLVNAPSEGRRNMIKCLFHLKTNGEKSFFTRKAFDQILLGPLLDAF